MPLTKFVRDRITIIVLMLLSLTVGLILPSLGSRVNFSQELTQEPTRDVATQTPSETIPPSTPLATLTPSQTLKPPPTFEPPTPTREATLTPTSTPTEVLLLEVQVPGLQGLETPTPTSTAGCEPRKDWQLVYEVQPNDALDRIAEKYGTNRWALAEGNCLVDANMIVIGQKLRVPGEAHPVAPLVECIPWEVLTPIDGAFQVDGYGQITFHWRGPNAPRNLIRVINPNGQVWERTLDLRQNEIVNIAVEPELLPEGTYTWYVYPLDMNFLQVACKEGGPWRFHKTVGPTPTFTPTYTPTTDPNATPTP